MLIIQTKEEWSESPAPPAHSDLGGETASWPFVVLSIDGRTFYSDTLTEIIEANIPGYVECRLTDDKDGIEYFDTGSDLALVARYDDLAKFARIMQETLLTQAVEDGTFDPSTISEDVLTALVSERHVLFTGVPLSDDPNDERVDLEWTAPVPLVLIATDYVPHTEVEAPTGNIIWLNPHTEMTYLQSLERLGVLKLTIGVE
jgi:hypothetical protein